MKGFDRMLFCEFAQKLSPALRRDENTVRFTRTLFESILPEDKKDLLNGISENTFKAYYNGHSSIAQISKKIHLNVKKELFEDFIYQHERNAILKLCNIFSETFPNISNNNTGKLLAKLFFQIINEAALETSVQAEQKIFSGRNYYQNAQKIYNIEHIEIFRDE